MGLNLEKQGVYKKGEQEKTPKTMSIWRELQLFTIRGRKKKRREKKVGGKKEKRGSCRVRAGNWSLASWT